MKSVLARILGRIVVRSSPDTDLSYPLLRPMLRAGRWAMLLALGIALVFAEPSVRPLGTRLLAGAAIVLYALISIRLPETPVVSPARVLVLLVMDLVFITLLVETSGGLRSPFFGLYYMVIVASALFYEVLGGLIAVLAVAVTVSVGETLRPGGAGISLEMFVPLAPYLLMAALVAGYLTSQLKAEMARRQNSERTALQLQAQRASLEREMALAREVQQAALPRLPESVPGLEIGICFRAAAHVGGDFYDYYQDGGELGLVVGDAGGKGVPAALVATMALHMFHTQAARVGLAGWCQAISRELDERTPGYMLATAFGLRLDPATGQGACVNAGHPPPVLCRRGETPRLMESTGIALGVSAALEYAESPLSLAPGDTLVVYTDGLTEARRPDGTMVDVEPLLEMLPPLMERPACEIARGIEAELLQMASLEDDLTLLVLKKT